MKRRAFVLGLGTALATWQLPARAEAEAGTIGLWWSAEQLNGELSRYKRRLAELGWSENGKVHFQALAWGGDTTIMAKQAGELLAMHPDVIVVSSNPALAILKPLSGRVPVALFS